jgi:hypothetical protein
MESLTKQVDFTIKSNVDRSSKVNEIVTENIESIVERLNDKIIEGQSNVTKQLEQLADYILYGKDVNEEKSAVDKKELLMTPKYSSYKKKEPESLDAILENPAHDERSFKNVGRDVYTNPKPTIDREKDHIVPGLIELWDAIDKLDLYLKKATGKEEWEEGDTIKELSSYELFKMRHWLIEMRKQQYVLKEEYLQPIRFKSVQHTSNRAIDWYSDAAYIVDGEQPCHQDNPGHWIADRQDDEWEWRVVREHTLDLSDPKHVQELINNYSKLKQDSYEDLQGDMKYILWTLDDLIEECEFSDARKDIIVRKIDGQTNVQLHDYMHITYGLDYSANYISTIFTHEICEKIARRHEMSREEWKVREDDKSWKVCTKCGKRKLANNDNFTKKKSSKDGLNTRCKSCEKEKRQMDKEKRGKIDV